MVSVCPRANGSGLSEPVLVSSALVSHNHLPNVDNALGTGPVLPSGGSTLFEKTYIFFYFALFLEIHKILVIELDFALDGGTPYIKITSVHNFFRLILLWK